MEFEDIVDMDWMNSHTTTDDESLTPIKSETLEFSSDYYNYGYMDPPFLQEEFLLDPLSAPPSASIEPDAALDHPSTPSAPLSSSKSEFTMPTTEQIKQLIELAKRQLALREQFMKAQPAITPEESKPTEEKPQQLILPPPSTEPESCSEKAGLPPLTAPLSIFGEMNDDDLPQTIAPESLIIPKEEKRRQSVSSAHDDNLSLERWAESDGIDLKKLTPKERRQLRNKISARNFRVRRKEYITTLEAQVDAHKRNADTLQMRLGKMEEENKQLRSEVDTLRRQNQLLLQQQQQQQQITPASSELTRAPSSPRITSPLPKPKNKDISMLGNKASETYRQDNCILVSNAVMPVWDLDRILERPAATMKSSAVAHAPVDPYLLEIGGYFILSLLHLAHATALSSFPSKVPSSSPSVDAVDQDDDAPLMPDDRDFTSRSDLKKNGDDFNPGYMEYLYDTLLMAALATNVTTRSFCWWDTASYQGVW
ncbi:uncharacterized protein BYT42DRAFT_548788 [Radiomyces spectabilis]|uniref:uncharacterized protein n=1 Tax=Radiomyces spectabilis TaxID=64574 RepID=UPI00221F8A9F|nr:uncharacterized protein BYT42DRAFT_548788 [Radiomyces spectabilis]KAI8370540.1 hypothetical protein BYT42DRAFT_548788 [Radiomyces spectabilis]